MNLGSSDPMIYKAMQRGGEIARWDKEDWYKILSGIQTSGRFAWCSESMKLTNPNPTISHAETPWCHAKHAPRKNCALDHHVLFNGFGIIHPRCLECWKVVASPNNFDELIQVEKLQRNELDVPCKAGIELRDYTPRHYGSYYYCHSVEEGRERYKQVRELMDEINPEIDVILKRGCTEYEMTKGPSIFWHATDKELEFAENVEHFVEVPANDNDQPQMMKRHIRGKWALWAHANGDMTYKKYNGDLELFPKCVTYHEGDLADVTHDLALGLSHAKGKLPGDKVEEFLLSSIKWSIENGVDPDQLGTALGQHGISAFNLKSFIKQVPEYAKGETDELE